VAASRPGYFNPGKDKMVCGPQSRSGRSGEEKKKIPAPTGTRTPVVQPVA